MKLASFIANEKERTGLVVGDTVFDIHEVVKAVPNMKTFSKPRFFQTDITGFRLIDLLELGMEGSDGLRRMNDFIIWVMEEGDSFLLRNARFDCEAIRWLPPIPNPPLMFGIGGNSPFFFRDKPYQIPGYPQGFLRPRSRTALIGHKETVTIPPYLRNFRSAAELGVIIGKTGRYVPAKEAMEYVAGYTLVNDMCSDTWKQYALRGIDEALVETDSSVFAARHTTSFYSRSIDTFAPVGPYLVSRDEVPDPYNLMIYNRLSGIQRERSYSQALVNDIEHTIEYLSRMFTLKPGMIIHMGTMSIDGYTVEQDMRLTDEDYFEIEYEKIGVLRNPVNDLRESEEEIWP